MNVGYEPCAGAERVTVIYSVDIAQYYQRLHSHHRGYEPRKLVIVGKHQFGHRHGVVLVYDGNDIVGKHHIHAVLLIEIVTTCGEILLCGENLSARNAVVAKQLIVTVDELCLSYRRI